MSRKQWERIGAEDARMLEEKERTYQGSWKKRGGVGAFMMLARKWDRLETIVEANGYDVFAAITETIQEGDESVIEQIRDLRRYLTLVEAEVIRDTETEVMFARTQVDQPFGYDILIDEGIFDPEALKMLRHVRRDIAPPINTVLVPFGSLKGRPLEVLYKRNHSTGDLEMRPEYLEEYA